MSRPPARPSERRSRGLAAEGLAARHLEARGWTIVARNHTCRMGEVDIVAEKDGSVAFVEVRSRTAGSFVHPLETLTWQKRRKVIAAAMDWAAKARRLDGRPLRFDVIVVLDRGGDDDEIEWIQGAFDAG
ncbi:MAG TPA: YraN family protein [Vulgatibacter sp.]